MFDIVLYQPEIPPNTGNIIRLCANTAARLHLVGPMGFVLDDARLRRAGLDYRDMADVRVYDNWESWLQEHGEKPLWAFSTRGGTRYDQVRFRGGDGLLFGPESRGLPGELLDWLGSSRVLRLPMRGGSRSLNLSNAVAVGLYEALRQNGFGELRPGPGAKPA
jgi:tRNA (cytidine/uridine-2'-O-)-methyltransferase